MPSIHAPRGGGNNRPHTDIPPRLFRQLAALLQNGHTYAQIANALSAHCPGLKPGRVSVVIKQHARDRAAFVARFGA